ncbi:hypothetical protein ACKKBF_B00775 [Auxenochlorella protothecoides x Auxenochlorella symbiontica]
MLSLRSPTAPGAVRLGLPGPFVVLEAHGLQRRPGRPLHPAGRPARPHCTRRVATHAASSSADGDGPPPQPPSTILRSLQGLLHQPVPGFPGASLAALLDRVLALAARVARACTLALALLAAACLPAQLWARPALQARLLPVAGQAATRLLGRECDPGALQALLPTGLVGLGPLARLGPLRLGPGATEGSSAAIESLDVHLDALRTLRERRPVLGLRLRGAQIDVVQGPNLSWFGFPEDTSPSARQFTPGLGSRTGPPGGRDGGEPGGGEPSAPGGGESSPPGPSPLPPPPPRADPQRALEGAARAVLSSLAQELRRLALVGTSSGGRLGDQSSATGLVYDLAGAPPWAAGPLGAEPWATALDLAAAVRGPGRAEAAADAPAGAAHGATNGACGAAAALNGLALRGDPRDIVNRGQKPGPLDAWTGGAVRPSPRPGSAAEVLGGKETSGAGQAKPAATEAGPAADGRRGKRRRGSAKRDTQTLALPRTLPPRMVAGDVVPGLARSGSGRLVTLGAPQERERSGRPGAGKGGRPAGGRAVKEEPRPEPPLVAPASGEAGPSSGVAARQAARPEPSAPDSGPTSSALTRRHEPDLGVPGADGAAQDAPTRKSAAVRSAALLRSRLAPLRGAPAQRMQTGSAAFRDLVVDPWTLRRKERSGPLSPGAPTKPGVPAPGQLVPSSTVGAPSAKDATAPGAALPSGDGGAAPLSLAPTPLHHHHHHHHAAAAAREGGAAAAGGQSWRGSAAAPLYTPAPSDGARDGLHMASGWLLDTLSRPLASLASRAALGSLDLSAHSVRLHVSGESPPRVLDDVRASVRFDPGHDGVHVALRGAPRARARASHRWTRVAPRAPTHLRDVTGRRAAAALAAAAEAAGPEAALAAALDVAGRAAEIGSFGVDGARAGSSTGAGAAGTGPRAGDAGAAPGRGTGGALSVRVDVTGLLAGIPTLQAAGQAAAAGEPPPDAALTPQDAPAPPYPALRVAVGGAGLHAPLIERLLDLPLDVYDGWADGELSIVADDALSWRSPRFDGRVRVRRGAFHFWDAMDALTGAELDLVFEERRLFLYGAAARFGALPLEATGDLDLAPRGGQLRLTARVAPTEVNALRASLGVRPLPFPLAGAAGGLVHVTGPLEKPVFSGTVQLVPAGPGALEDAEESAAMDALQATPGALGAFDRVPLRSAEAVFSLDTATQRLEVHAVHAAPCDAGAVHGHGHLSVSPDAEADPDALDVDLRGSGIEAGPLLKRFLPGEASLPSSLSLGAASFEARIRGSALSPAMHADFRLPALEASGSLRSGKTSCALTLASPYADVAAEVGLVPPPPAASVAAVTQRAAAALARPAPDAASLAVTLRGLDLLPLVSDELAARQVARAQLGTPLRLRLSGAGSLRGAVRGGESGRAAAMAEAGLGGWAAGADDAKDESGDAQLPHPAAETPAWEFTGGLGLEALRLNQLRLFKRLDARVAFSPHGVRLEGRGARADEALDVDLSLPSLLRQLARRHGDSGATGVEVGQAEGGGTGAGADDGPNTPALRPEDPVTAPNAEAGAASEPLDAAPDRLATADPQSAGPTMPASAPSAAAVGPGGAAAPPPAAEKPRGGHFYLRGGPLVVSGDAEADGSRLGFKVQGLKLDELEIASLRGDLQEASASLNFASQTGSGKLQLAGPRFSGVRGESLACSLRWERDIVQLERACLAQAASRYEVQGEYILPPGAALPRCAGDLLARRGGQGGTGAGAGAGASPAPRGLAGGKWRVQVNVPAADMQEILPAARVLQNATGLRPSDYERCKADFLAAMASSGLSARGGLGAALPGWGGAAGGEDGGVAAARDGGDGGGAPTGPSPLGTLGSGAPDGHAPPAGGQLPGLQDVAGRWRGRAQVYGSSHGSLRAEFDVRGDGWRWGPWALDSATAVGSYHSEEGLHLQEFALALGDAKLLVRGGLLGAAQDASLLLTDFPVATLRPLFRGVPALRHAVPAAPPAPGAGGGGAAPPRPPWLDALASSLSGAVGRLGRGLLTPATRSGLAAAAAGAADGGGGRSPIDGLLYVSGSLRGSAAAPRGDVAVRLFDAALGDTRLARAAGRATLSEDAALAFEVDLAPAERAPAGRAGAGGKAPRASGAVHAEGSLGLGPAGAADVRVSVRDGGMALITAMLPDVSWEGGGAEVLLDISGPVADPMVSGTARLTKGVLACPYLKFPLRGINAQARCEDGVFTLDAAEARSGRTGIIRAKGWLPLTAGGAARMQAARGAAPDPAPAPLLAAEASNLELRVRGAAAVRFEAALEARGSLAAPRVGGRLRVSHGTITVLPGSVESAAIGGGGESPTTRAPPAAQGPVSRAFDALVRGKGRLAERLEAALRREVATVVRTGGVAGGGGASAAPLAAAAAATAWPGAGPPPAPPTPLPPPLAARLEGLEVTLGPDLRAVVPVVMNVGVEGRLVLDAGAGGDPRLRARGRLSLPGGDLNLVATQLSLDREHANALVFAGDPDPRVDLVLLGGDLRVAIQGPAREWQEHMTLQHVSGEGAGALDVADAARIFEDRLKSALLADDGRLALSRLAGSTVAGLMPRIESSGQVGGATWRLVSAPSIPGLLEPGGGSAQPSGLLSSITVGTEVEVQFGRKLQAALVRKLRDSDVATQWTLTYALSRQVRVQFNITSAAPYARTLYLQYSSEGAPNAE